MRVIVLELCDYEGWILSLGSDREWKVQVMQHRLYSELQRAVSEHGGFLVPLTFHNMLIIANGMDSRANSAIFEILRSASPVPFKAADGTGNTILTAARNAHHKLKRMSAGETDLSSNNDSSNVVAAHFDLNSYLEKLRNGPLDQVIEQINALISHVNEISKTVQGVSAYLGGDNVALFTDESSLSLLENIKHDQVKVGIGVARTARESLRLAAEGLSFIRRNRGINVKVMRE
ncbi:MAG: GTP cyclohydrolase IIa [Nitrososphaeria archaeon]